MIKRNKLVIKLTCLLVVLLSLSGCWNQSQIEERAYVIAIGIDQAEKDNRIQITYLIANPEHGSQALGGGTDEPPHQIISFVTDDITTARNTANAVIAKEITYDLVEVLAVSEDFAKDKDFIRWMYDVTKDPEIRRDVSMLVTKEKTSEFFKNNKPKFETRPHKYFKQVLKRGVETGMLPESDLIQFFRITEADADLFLAMYGSTEKEENGEQDSGNDHFSAGDFEFKGRTNQTNFAGSAVFKEGKMIDKISADETRISIILNPLLNASDILTTYEDPFNEKFRVAVRVNKKKSNKMEMDLKAVTPTIHVSIPFEIEVLSAHSMIDYAKDLEKRAKLKKSIEKELKQKIENFVKKTQEEFKAEPFHWSLLARKEFLTVPSYKKFDWMKTYPEMKIEIDVVITFGQFGRQSQLPKLKEIRD
ncbi:Ger(x)C family spore germination protein [Virgibacillus sp. DJP39]|uniref:Ger(x)C family spore germination protein n=1 Tax=Virgibacillus sp. DJP39 TaxID=3409790 RepID=UPI003BB61235